MRARMEQVAGRAAAGPQPRLPQPSYDGIRGVVVGGGPGKATSAGPGEPSGGGYGLNVGGAGSAPAPVAAGQPPPALARRVCPLCASCRMQPNQYGPI